MSRVIAGVRERAAGLTVPGLGSLGRRGLVLVTVLALLGLVVVGSRVFAADDKQLTATFPRTISLYEGAKVKVLGVDVGKVESVEVVGTGVEVEMTYREDVELPDDVNALVVPPSIVGDRFVQLAPAYIDGPTLDDGAELGLERTSVPLELDDAYRGLDKLTEALGPEGANKNGALSRLIGATAENLDGNGRRFNETIRQFGAAMATLSASRQDFSGTVRNLNRLAGTFAREDPTVRRLVQNLTLVSAQLSGQRGDIRRTVRDLAVALDEVESFTRENRDSIKGNITALRDVTTTLSRHTEELAFLTEVAPVGLVGLMNIYEPRNWDQRKPGQSKVFGRTGAQALRAATLNDLETQLSYSLGALCESLPPGEREQIGAFCDALGEAGGSLGRVLQESGEEGGPSS